MYRHILFDLDGTLTDPFEGITNSVVHALKRYNIEVTDKRELRSFIGPPLVESFMKYFNFTEADAKNAVEVYREHFSTKGLFENELYEGIPNMLSELKSRGKTVIMATSKPEVYARRIAEHFDIAKYFDYMAGSELNGQRIAKTEVIEYALSSLGISDRRNCLMVGDRLHDINGAKKSDIHSVGVLWGYGSREELEEAGADYICSSVENLIDIIK
ncbi:MAG: HAD family hydrolase [Clostridia bacterium]|nr:HAD family hydrolase [Clostridia bacterium]